METQGQYTERSISVVFAFSKVFARFSEFGKVANSYRWSFGGNRLQLKAEARLMADVEVALGTVASVGSKATRVLQSLATRHDLLIRLLDDEHMRLHVWLTPLDHEPRRLFSSSHSHSSIAEVSISGHIVLWKPH